MARDFLVLTELTLPRLLVAAALGRRPAVLAVDPALPPLRRPLERLLSVLAAAGRAQTVATLFPAMDAMVRNPNLSSLEDLFADLEPWQNVRYRFAEADRDPAYGMAYKQVTCKYLQDRYAQLMFLKAARADGGTVTVAGRWRDAADLDSAWTGRPAAGPRSAHILGVALNGLLALAMVLACWAWIAPRIRRRVEPREWFLAADYLKDARDCRVYAEAADGGPVLLVKRNPTMDPAAVPCGAGLPACEADDGLFTPGQAAAAAVLALVHTFAILRRWYWSAPAHFFALAALPHKRIRIRALLQRHRPRHMWCRDEYNVEHILRTQELHRIGARSLGLMHGIQALADLNPRRRYVDFDVFYVFGLHLIDRLYRTTWAPHMKVQPVGSFGFTREQLAAGARQGSDVVAIFGNICLRQPEFAATVRGIAIAFPQLRVVVKPKLGREDPGFGPFCAQMGEGLANVEVETGDAGELMARARYVVSDASTVIAESIHLGVPAVMLDVAPDHRTCLYRDFPGLCQTTPEAVVARLRGFEDGGAPFDRAAHASLVDLSGRHFLDFIRADLGLPDRWGANR
ncbi:hypothetical protein [Magnetospirillum sp. UT-4]|uniref:hypothetical protein n=1 Tax=Magnetospirillum sp. UT-4 TaxID=2681467 RepID=UPI0013834656|nr:hypothetical protein [Magnetospirillum sp. UT-4]CAA7621747.1 hypothetical protein MTBUT4_40092 [Magnetospirillum sp. UT-4]